MRLLSSLLVCLILASAPAHAFKPITFVKKVVRLPIFLTVGAVGGTYAAFNYYILTEIVDIDKVLYRRTHYPMGETENHSSLP